MTGLRADLPPLPERFKRLPIDERGFPVPWFVDWLDGKPFFQTMDPRKFRKAVKFKRCWLCGEQLGRHMTFVIGPMCGINRVSSEPPCHHDCAEFAATACPFLTRPMAKRNLKGIDPETVKKPAGIMIARNPGVTLLWTTKDYRTFNADNGQLIKIGEPTECLFYAQGRAATREEINASVTSGLPLLQEMAEKDGLQAIAQLSSQILAFKTVLDRSLEEKSAAGERGQCVHGATMAPQSKSPD
jgi:hypothetical protein